MLLKMNLQIPWSFRFSEGGSFNASQHWKGLSPCRVRTSTKLTSFVLWTNSSQRNCLVTWSFRRILNSMYRDTWMPQKSKTMELAIQFHSNAGLVPLPPSCFQKFSIFPLFLGRKKYIYINLQFTLCVCVCVCVRAFWYNLFYFGKKTVVWYLAGLKQWHIFKSDEQIKWNSLVLTMSNLNFSKPYIVVNRKKSKQN